MKRVIFTAMFAIGMSGMFVACGGGGGGSSAPATVPCQMQSTGQAGINTTCGCQVAVSPQCTASATPYGANGLYGQPNGQNGPYYGQPGYQNQGGYPYQQPVSQFGNPQLVPSNQYSQSQPPDCYYSGRCYARQAGYGQPGYGQPTIWLNFSF